MSCQQVPRLIEDPYTFTETPVGTTYFTSPIQKHTTIKSANQLPSQLKSISNRLNGTTKNGVTSHSRQSHVPVYAKQPIYQQHQQPHQPHQRCQQENIVKSSPIIKKDSSVTPIIVAQNHNANIQKNSVIYDTKSTISSNHSTTGNLSTSIKPSQTSIKNSTQTNGNDAVTTNGNYQSNGILNGTQMPLNNGNGTTKILNTENDTFVKPKTDGKRISLTGKSQTNGKRKRGYSQTSHHEVLQRIPQRSNGHQQQQQQQQQQHQPQLQQQQKLTELSKIKREWNAPDTLLYDYVSANDKYNDDRDIASCTQTYWFRDISNENLLTREQRLETKRDNLRRQAFQYLQAQNFRNKSLAKMRFISVMKALNKFNLDRDINSQQTTKCSITSCSNNVLALTAYCHLHITLNTDQKLFHPCTAKFSDNSQCRVPVFDISHELPLCPEHAWKRDNYNRMLQEQKPKKTIRKKNIKPVQQIRTPKRYKKKKKQIESNDSIDQIQLSLPEVQPQQLQQQQPLQQLQQQQSQQQIQKIRPGPKLFTSSSLNNLSYDQMFEKDLTDHIALSKTVSNIPVSLCDYFIDSNSSKYHTSIAPNLTHLQQHQQEMFTVCENSSAYESSEDTGVGGLSESELISASDGIEIPLGDARLLEEHDITNVLEQLPEDAFNDLFEGQQNDHYEPTQKEQDELARALEEADQQVKSLKQITGSDFLDSFLDVGDEIFVDNSDICADVLTAAPVKNDIRGLVHT